MPRLPRAAGHLPFQTMATWFIRALAGLAVAAALVSGGCARYARGGVNDIDYDMSLDRPAIAGGIPYSIEIRMEPGSATDGTLWVDGVGFGRVHSGDRVEVTRKAVVLVNGEPRDRITEAAAPGP